VNRIICVGNRLIREDAAGPAIHDRLAARDLPADVELIDGGTAGLDLLRFLDGAERVVLVDSVVGYGAPGEAVVLDADEVGAMAAEVYDHAAGLPYLLRCLPHVCEEGVPQVVMVGVEGLPDDGALARAAELALHLASGTEHQPHPERTEGADG
jgi:hydrogenase maturation protease